MSRFMPAVAGAGVLAVVVVASMSGRGSSTSPAVTEPSAAPAAVSATLTIPTTLPISIDTAAVVQKTTLTKTLAKGSFGDDVKAVQQRLTDLGFAPGPIDGSFGEGTRQAVWAFEKLVLRTPRAKATGKVTNEMWQTMQDPITIPARRPTGAGSTHLEVYVPEQVAIAFVDDKPKIIAHISTGEQEPDGKPKEWCENTVYDTDLNGNPYPEPVKKQECALAKTPGGVFRFTHNFVGKRQSPLGGMMNPWYFNYGIAIHGADNVPLQPASHACVRVNQRIAKDLPTLFHKGDRVYVWGQDGKDPEQYSKRESLPSFNYADPNATTTTSSTTTTVPKSTTTVVAATTTVPKTTTTTAAPATTTSSTTPPATTTTTTLP